MNSFKIKSFAKINLALNVTGKKSKLHNIESLISFIDLHDSITLRESNTKQHKINFFGKFSKNISKINTISKLLKILDNKKLLDNKKFEIKVIKNIPQKAGMGGGSMNVASLLNFFIEKKIIKICDYLELNDCSFDGFINWILDLRKKLDMPHKLSEVIDEKDFDLDRLSKMALADPSTGGNPKKLTEADMKIMYQHSMSGELFK